MMEPFAQHVAAWLAKRVEEAEKSDPLLRRLKADIASATSELDRAMKEGSDVTSPLKAQEAAIISLLKHQGVIP